MQVILASKSPRRAQLLTQIGLKFTIVPSHVDESIHVSKNPVLAVRQLAIAKAKFVAKQYKAGLIVGADTVVVLGQKILGKPKDITEAQRLLTQLSGKTHRVITGIAIVDAKSNRKVVGHCVTFVTFRKLTKSEIDEYIKTGEPFDKAGAYGIQGKGALFVKRIEGDYFNVVGLPLVLLMELIKRVRKVPKR
ncbi:MAG: Maf family protein [bacterium]|nr:Maf family protein [bacterium]